MGNKKYFLIVTIFLFSALFLLSNLSFVLGQTYIGNVAYITNNLKNIKPEVRAVFNELNLNITPILDSKVPTTNFSKYKMIFVDDAYLPKSSKYPIYNYPSVIMNKYYGYQWGLTDYDGISQLASTSALYVKLVNDDLQQVYTQARFPGTSFVSIPYYYLDDLNKAPVVESIARAYYGGSADYVGPEFEFGDAIASIQKGTTLKNGHVAGGKICFYGIAKSPYWTDTSKDLFRNCITSVLIECKNDSYCEDNNDLTQDICLNPNTINSTCIHQPITCFDDSDCGNNFITGLFCSNNNITKNSTTFTCHNKGLGSSYCTNTTTSILNKTCSFLCLNAQCVLPQCSDGIDNDDRDLLIDIADPGCHTDGNSSNNNSYDPNDNNESNPPIICYTHLQCGLPSSALSCLNDNSVNTTTTPNCINAGTTSSYCTNITTNSTTICLTGCTNGLCNAVHNVAIDLALQDSLNGIRIGLLDGTPILDFTAYLLKNSKYNFTINLTNKGTYVENVSLVGSSGCSGLSITGVGENNLGPLSSKIKSYLRNASCNSGYYNFSFFANLTSGIDADPSDNTRIRQIRVVDCFLNSDCSGSSGVLNYYCIGNQLWKNISSPACVDYSCTNSLTQAFNNICTYGCTNASCNNENIPPVVKLINPQNHMNTTETTITFFYNATDDSGVSICYFLLDGSAVAGTSFTPSTFVSSNFTYTLGLGLHDWYVSCNDIYGNTGVSEQRTIEILPGPQCEINHDCGNPTSTLVCNANVSVNTTIVPTCLNSACTNITTINSTQCAYGCNSQLGTCNPPIIRCYNDSQCGINGPFGNSFCTGSNKTQLMINFVCNNKGLSSSYCSNSTSLNLLQVCAYGCNLSSGNCNNQVSVCGNGIVEIGEQCDDGNLINLDGCSSTCTIENQCPYQCNPHNCNPFNCKSYKCNVHDCNPHSCNCQQICYWGVCHTECDTCYDSCYDTCWDTCYNTCYDTCYNWC